MATTIGSLLINLGLETGAFKSGLTNADKELKAATRRMAQAGKDMQDLGQKLTIGVTAPLAAFGGFAVKAASEANELQSAFNVTFGAMSAEMNRWAEQTGNAMGRSTQEMQRAANTFGMFFNQAAPTKQAAADMSKTFASLAQDLGSFFNVDTQTAIDKLRSGLSGESEPLRDFGVFLTEAAVKAKALEMGLVPVGGELTEQQKILARYNLILESTKNAQGDVARTSDGFANKLRATQARFDELKVSVGEKLLPVLARLLGVADQLLAGFQSLSPMGQNVALAIAGIAAAAGPLLSVIGLITTSTAGFTAALGLIGGSGGIMAAVSAGFSGLLAVIAPIAAPMAGLAAAGALIYMNWGKIAPVLQEFWKSAQQALGPEIQQLVTTLSATVKELWNGPFGAGLRAAISQIGELGVAVARVMGPVTIGLLKGMLVVANETFGGIASAIRGVSQLLNGDWRGALDAAQGLFRVFSFGVSDLAAKLGNAIGIYLRDRLNEVWANLKAKIDFVKNAFFNLYDAVVGHSYVPDMVDGIAAEMARLDSVMVQPAAKGTAAVKAQFEKMQADVRQIMDRLFPEAAEKAQRATDTATLNAAERAGNSGFTADQLRAARDRLNPVQIEQPLGDPFNLDKINKALPEFGDLVGTMASKVEVSNVRVVESFGDMANKTLGALDRVAQSIKGGGGFLDIMSSVLGLITQLGSIGLFGSNIAGRINTPSIPKYANGTDWHPGGVALVGERGPELVNLPRGSSVTPNGQWGQGGPMNIQVEASPYFDVRVNGQIVKAAPAIAAAGGEVGVRRMSGAQSRKLG